MSESLFAFLFKYRPLVFREGSLELGGPFPAWLVLLGAAALAVPAAFTYARARSRGAPPDRGAVDRVVLVALRSAAVALVVLCLFRPRLVLSTVVPQQNFLGILVDDSRSMRIADADGTPRSAFVDGALAAEGPLASALAERFALRYFRFASGTERVADLASLTYEGTRTELAQALDRARGDLQGVPLSGLVLVTDGADHSRDALAEALVGLRAASVPVYTVGIGAERLARDIELSRVDPPRRVLVGASLVVDVVIAHRGFGGTTVPLHVEDGGRIVSTQDVVLPRGDEPATVRVRFTASEPGPRRFRFRVPPQPGEELTENNVREVMVDVGNRREKILYLEGEPRFEVKFLRRAVAEDDNLQVVLLQRTAEDKFLRLDVDDGDELVGGFPRTREELFRYRGLVLGSVEASFFTRDQLEMIEDFVSQRGGGLLMLGGRRSFSEGGYAGTPVAEVLPVHLEAPLGAPREFFAEISVSPTRAGVVHPATQIGPSEEESAERWATLPVVSTFNPVRRVKAGATVLLEGSGAAIPDEQVVLAYHRYGRGKALAFPVQDSWTWQMHADIPVDDPTHQTFWKQVLRWLADGVPDPVVARTSRESVEPGDAVDILASVEDSAYVRVNDGGVSARIGLPSGDEVEVPLDWSVDRDGEYEAAFVPQEEGLHRIHVEARRGDEPLGSGVTWLDVGPSDDEFFDAGMRASLLRRIAAETGGRFYTPGTVASLPEDVAYTGAGITVTEERDLWDMPAVFLLLMALVTGEWVVRRWRGLP